eukprot:927230_1
MCGGNRDNEDHEDVDFLDLEEMEAQTGKQSGPPVHDRVRSWAMSWSNMMSVINFWGAMRIAGWLLFLALLVFGLYRGLRGSNTDGIPMATHTTVPIGTDRKARGAGDKARTTINLFNVPPTTDAATDALPYTTKAADASKETQGEPQHPATSEETQSPTGPNQSDRQITAESKIAAAKSQMASSMTKPSLKQTHAALRGQDSKQQPSSPKMELHLPKKSVPSQQVVKKQSVSQPPTQPVKMQSTQPVKTQPTHLVETHTKPAGLVTDPTGNGLATVNNPTITKESAKEAKTLSNPNAAFTSGDGMGGAGVPAVGSLNAASTIEKSEGDISQITATATT